MTTPLLIWGSTVNLASRMESNGEPGKVNISAITFELVKEKFVCQYRGKIMAKNVSEVDMYFVSSEKVIVKDEPNVIMGRENVKAKTLGTK